MDAGSEKRNGSVVVIEDPEWIEAGEIVDKIKDDPEGEWVNAIYEAWDVSGEPGEPAWAYKWDDFSKLLKKQGVSKDLIAAIKVVLITIAPSDSLAMLKQTETVHNDDLGHLHEDNITWGSLQNVLRQCWEGANQTDWYPLLQP